MKKYIEHAITKKIAKDKSLFIECYLRSNYIMKTLWFAITF